MKPLMPAALMVIGLGISWLIFRERDEAGEVDPNQPPPAEVVKLEKKYGNFEDPEPISLEELLSKPRAELATLNAEYEQKVTALERFRKEGKALLHLLPEARIPLAWPIWQEANYSPQLEMMVPPYLPSGQKDAVLAVHLARFGDLEGARKLADPSDAALQSELAKYALPRNYPAEWTRLVALILDKAHMNLAAGETAAAMRIASLHGQLDKLLGPEARASQLGAVLWPRGRTGLFQAVEAWRGSKEEELVRLAEPILARWGDVKGPTWPPIAKSADLARWIDGTTKGLLVTAKDARRARDVLELQVPGHSLQSVVAAVQPGGEVQEIRILYNPEVIDAHDPRHLSYFWDEQLVSASSPSTEFAPEVVLTHTNFVTGPIVRLIPKSRTPSTVALPRDFGTLSLDRSFDAIRRVTAWSVNGTHVAIADAKLVAKIDDPLTWKLAGADLNRAGENSELVDTITLKFKPSDKASLVDLAGPLWEKYGAGELTSTGTSSKDSLDIVWTDARTSYRLRVPHHKEYEVSLEVRDVSKLPAAERLEQVRARDGSDRRARFESDKPVQRLSRTIEGVELGMTRDDFDSRMMRARGIRSQTADGTLAFTFPDKSADEVDWLLRQAVGRFADDKLTEVRLRFADGGKVGTGRGVLDTWRKRAAPDAVTLLPSPDASTSKKDAPKSMRWQDDRTLVQARVDATGVEVTLKDCPLEHPSGRTLPPLSWLPRGPKNIRLGMPRAELYKQWNVNKPSMTGGAVQLTPSVQSPYDAILVWFDKEGKVNRILGQYRGPEFPSAAAAGEAIAHAWGQDLGAFGWPTHVKRTRHNFTQAWSNSDDVTTVRVFWEVNDGRHIYCEWK